jgi:hypothetical protein
LKFSIALTNRFLVLRMIASVTRSVIPQGLTDERDCATLYSPGVPYEDFSSIVTSMRSKVFYDSVTKILFSKGKRKPTPTVHLS